MTLRVDQLGIAKVHATIQETLRACQKVMRLVSIRWTTLADVSMLAFRGESSTLQ